MQDAAPDDVTIWRLIKGANVAAAVTRTVPRMGIELRYAYNDEVRATQIYRTPVELSAAAYAKRDELKQAGWRDAPPAWPSSAG